MKSVKTTKRGAEPVNPLPEDFKFDFKALINVCIDYIYVINRNNMILFVNRAAADLFHRKSEDIPGKTIFELFPPEIASQYAKSIAKVFESGKILSLENKMVIGQSTFWNSTQLIPIKDEKGNIGKVFGISRDITDKVRKNEVLTEFTEVVQQTADYVIITDSNGAIKYVNRAFETQTGFSKQEVIGQTPRILKSGEHSQAFYRKLWSKIHSGKPFYGELINRKKNGQLYYEIKTITPILDDEGHITHYVSTGKDITSKKADEQRLIQSERKLQEQNRLLEQKNMALRELTEQLRLEKERVEVQVQMNIQQLITPDLQILKSKVDEIGDQYIQLIEDNLENLTSSFGKKITTSMLALTPKEIEICKMIKSGLSSKEISQLLNVSYRTVEVHRTNIRKKLNLKNTSVNLVTYLKSLEQQETTT